MNAHQLRNVIRRNTASTSLQELRKAQEAVDELLNLLNTTSENDPENLRSYLMESLLFTPEDLSGELSEFTKEMLLPQLTALNARIEMRMRHVEKKLA